MRSQTEEWSAPLRLRAWGDHACFTTVGTRAEPYSYPFITATAAVGLIEAIFWKPEIEYLIRSIEILRPIRRSTMCVNGVNGKGRYGTETVSLSPVQRNITILRDVDYVIEYSLRIKDANHEPHGQGKYIEQISRRVNSGSCFRDPCFGMQKFKASFGPVDQSTPRPIDLTMDVGMVPHSRVWGRDRLPGQKRSASITREYYFPARIVRGVVTVPEQGVA